MKWISRLFVKHDFKSERAYLTPVEVALKLDVSARSVRRWLTDGTLPGVLVGGRYRVDPEDLKKFVEPVRARSAPQLPSLTLLHSRKCVVCSNSFDPTRSDMIYCTSVCRQRAYRMRRRYDAAKAHVVLVAADPTWIEIPL